jgi:hypothetical protein
MEFGQFKGWLASIRRRLKIAHPQRQRAPDPFITEVSIHICTNHIMARRMLTILDIQFIILHSKGFPFR